MSERPIDQMEYGRADGPLDLWIQRQPSDGTRIFGRLFLQGKPVAYTLEDATPIPDGRYSVVITFSTRFQRMLPLVVNVPNVLGIRLHPGNTSDDTTGCILLGLTKTSTRLLNSAAACTLVQHEIAVALASSQPVWLTLTSARPPSSPRQTV